MNQRARNLTAATTLTNGRKPPKTTCKICWKSIFDGEQTVWVTTPSPGIAHQQCATPPSTERR